MFSSHLASISFLIPPRMTQETSEGIHGLGRTLRVEATFTLRGDHPKLTAEPPGACDEVVTGAGRNFCHFRA